MKYLILPRLLSALSLLLILGLAIHGSCTRRDAVPSQSTAPVAESQRKTAPQLPSAVLGSSASTLSEAIVRSAAAKRAALDVAPPDEALLYATTLTVLSAILTADFEPYDSLLTSHGYSPTPAASANIEDERVSKRYTERQRATLREGTVRDQLAFLWEHPELRNVRVIRLDETNVTVGHGWKVGPEWRWIGVSGLICTYLPMTKQDDLALRGADGKTETSWIQFPVELNGGQRGHLRVTFVRDPQVPCWLPLRLDYPRNLSVPIF